MKIEAPGSGTGTGKSVTGTGPTYMYTTGTSGVVHAATVVAAGGIVCTD